MAGDVVVPVQFSNSCRAEPDEAQCSRPSKKKAVSIKKPAFAETAKAGEVGAARFELTTSWSQTKRDTGLRYAPNIF